jgi:hypothetical protein
MHIIYADTLSNAESDKLINKNEERVWLTAEAITTVYLVNYIPIHMLIYRCQAINSPSFHQSSTSLPGYQSGFQQMAAHVKDLNNKIHNGPWYKVLKDIVSCFSIGVSHLIFLVL